MAAINPTGMGNKTARQYNRVARNIMKYANSVYEYEETYPVGKQAYDSHSTVKHTTKLHDTTLSTLYPTPVSTLLSSTDRRHVLRQNSR